LFRLTVRGHQQQCRPDNGHRARRVAGRVLPHVNVFSGRGARDVGKGHVEITNDPLGLRIGAIVRPFDSSAEVASALSPWFETPALGECRDDYYGLRQDMWIAACRRGSATPNSVMSPTNR
jgi:hypothetical protein